jgi:hypothetical protein
MWTFQLDRTWLDRLDRLDRAAGPAASRALFSRDALAAALGARRPPR